MNHFFPKFCVCAAATLFVAGPALSQQAGAPATPAPGAPRVLTPAEQKAADMRVPNLDRSALVPESRVEEEVAEDEKSPFGELVTTAAGLFATKEPVTEEKRIREVLNNMRVSGLSGLPGAYRALVGPMALAKGEILPPLFASQAEVLKVRDVTERAVVLEFVESGSAKPPRTIGLPVSLAPRVDSLLPGEMFLKLVPLDAEGSPIVLPRTNDSAESVAKAMESQELQSLVERRTELLNAPAAPPKTDENTKEAP